MGSTDLTQLRLECLRLAHTHGLTINEVLGKAETYVKFVTAPVEVAKPVPASVPVEKSQKDFKSTNRKHGGNADILS